MLCIHSLRHFVNNLGITYEPEQLVNHRRMRLCNDNDIVLLTIESNEEKQ